MSAASPNRPPAPRSGATRLRFGRGLRLAQSRDFARVRQRGERLAQGCLIANWHKLPDGAAPKLGVVTSKKIGGAPERSRARRLLRESFRLHQHELTQPVELVLVARNSIAGKKFADVEKDFLAALSKAGLRRK
jgi:ribonuclease P protein component